jgi:hypothetical protein
MNDKTECNKPQQLNPVQIVARYDIARLLKYSKSFHDPQAILTRITINYHIVEKGMSMPNRRYRFAQDKVVNLNIFLKRYIIMQGDLNHSQFMIGISVAQRYFELHLDNGIEIEDFYPQVVYDAWIGLGRPHYPAVHEVTAESYFANTDAPFEAFAHSRRSVRNLLPEPIDIEVIRQAVAIANSSPSVCNRQSVKVRFFNQYKKVQQILELQNGNRGFGDRIGNIAIISSSLGSFVGLNERHQPFVDGGIYLMSFVFPLCQRSCRVI